VELRVVGVVGDAQVSALGRVDPFYVYFPTRTAEKLLVRSRVDFAATAAAVRAAVRRIDPGLPAPMYPLEANLERARSLSGLVTLLAGALGGLALVLAAVGIYGVVSHFVGRRFREIGIRQALGASAASIYRLVFTRTLRPVGIGAAFGVAGALAVSGVLSSVLFGVSPLDPLGASGAALFVLAVGLGASWMRHLPGGDPGHNYILPWELEYLLLEHGWRLLDGWGEWGDDLYGTTNDAHAAYRRADRAVQQATATTWTVIAA
jgi:hypothetical protein